MNIVGIILAIVILVFGCSLLYRFATWDGYPSEEETNEIIEKAINNLVESSKQRQLELEREEEGRDYEEAMRRRKMNRELDKYYTHIKNRGY